MLKNTGLRFPKKAKALASSLILNFGFSFIFSVVLSRCMEVSERGDFYTYQMIAMTLVAFSSFSFPHSIVIALSSDAERKADFFSLIAFFSISVLLTILLSVAVGGFFLNELSSVITVFMSLATLISVSVVEVFKINRNMRSYAVAYKSKPGLMLLMLLPLYFGLSPSLINVIYLFCIASILMFVLFCYLLNKELHIVRRADLPIFRRPVFWSASLKMTVMRGLGAITLHVDKIVFAAFFSSSVMGLYAVCMSLESISSRTFKVLSDTVFSSSVNVNKNGGDIKKIIILSFFIGVMGILFSVLLGKQVILLLFGERFVGAYEYLPLVIAISVVAGWNWIATQSHIVKNKYAFLYVRQILSIIIFLALVFFVFESRDEVAVLVSSLIATIFRFLSVVSYSFIGKKHRV